MRSITSVLFLMFLVFMALAPSSAYADERLWPKAPQPAATDNRSWPSVDWLKLKETWLAYLNYPSSENADKVSRQLPSQGHVKYTGATDEHDAVNFVYDNLGMLSRQIYSGDRSAVRLGFRLFSVSDAAFSEELDIILGSLIRINPRLFLEVLNENQWALKNNQGLLVNFGGDYVDRPNADELEISLRIAALRSVDDPSLAPLRDECLQLLKGMQQTR